MYHYYASCDTGDPNGNSSAWYKFHSLHLVLSFLEEMRGAALRHIHISLFLEETKRTTTSFQISERWCLRWKYNWVSNGTPMSLQTHACTRLQALSQNASFCQQTINVSFLTSFPSCWVKCRWAYLALAERILVWPQGELCIARARNSVESQALLVFKRRRGLRAVALSVQHYTPSSGSFITFSTEEHGVMKN